MIVSKQQYSLEELNCCFFRARHSSTVFLIFATFRRCHCSKVVHCPHQTLWNYSGRAESRPPQRNGNSHRPWWVAKRADRWCRELDWRAIVGFDNRHWTKDVQGQRSARGKGACWRRALCQIAVKVPSLSITSYNTMQNCPGDGEPGNFIGSSLTRKCVVVR